MGEEQRGAERKPLQGEFRGKDATGAGELWFEGVDLSAGGSFLRSELLLEQGENLQVEFRIPNLARPLRAQARVAWVRRFPEPGEPPGMGVQFLSMADEDRRILTQYLSSL
jgi:uncharacterized protein (TIGR02266 family)